MISIDASIVQHVFGVLKTKKSFIIKFIRDELQNLCNFCKVTDTSPKEDFITKSTDLHTDKSYLFNNLIGH